LLRCDRLIGEQSSRGLEIGSGRELENERELIRSMLAGDERAFNAFFADYFPRVYRFVLPRVGGDADAAKDVVQATLVKAMRSLGQFRGEAALFSWVCQIGRHQVADYLRAQHRYTKRVVPIDDSPEIAAALESIAAPAADEPATRYSNDETRRLVQSVLDRLPGRYGDVLEWKYVEGRSVEEIGELLGVGHTAAQSLLARARIAFREALETVFGSTAADVLASMQGGM
jgi:RNA polymerase sigma-70 factor, ECF subfamily